MFCVAKFKKHKFVRLNKVMLEYPVTYWLFDPIGLDTVMGKDDLVKARIYPTFALGLFSGLRLATWKDISDDTILHFDNGLGWDGSFCIQSRADKKNNKYQFLLGSRDAEIKRFNFNYCTMTDDNNEIENGYYEVPANLFTDFVNKIRP